MKTVDMPPYAPTLIESTRAIGYSLEAALADIIDNSIAAKADSVEVSFFPIGEAYVSILDNGSGMDEEQLNRAMQYGSQSPIAAREKTDLGRFGLGLKTASLSQCRTLTVISKQNGKMNGRSWDIDHVIEAGSWSLLVLSEEEMQKIPNIDRLSAQKSGTLVVWQHLDRMMMGEVDFERALGRKMDDVRAHLGLVYHRYISGESGIKKLKLSLNNAKVPPIDPFLSKKSTRAMDDEVIIIRGKRVVVRPYILPHLSRLSETEKQSIGGKEGLRKQQGFYVYRNKRLLVWGTWFRMMRQSDMSKLARVMVDIPNDLDDLWTLDIKKSHAIPPAEVRRNLQSIIERIAEKSKRTWTFRGKKETSDTVEHVWSRIKTPGSGVIYTINRDHPLVEQMIEANPRAKSGLEMLLRQIEKSIPLNQLYVDLNNDEKIENEAETENSEVKQMLEQMLSAMPSSILRLEFLNRVENTEPFSHHPDVIKALKAKEVQ